MPHSCNESSKCLGAVALLQIFKVENTACLRWFHCGNCRPKQACITFHPQYGVKCTNFGKFLKTSKKNSNTISNSFNHFTTEMPNYNKETTPDTTEIYSFFGQPGFNLFNASKTREKSKPTVSYSTVIVHGPNPKPSK